MQSLVRWRSSSSASVPRAAASSYDASVSSGTSPGTPRCPMISGGFPSRVRKCLLPAGAEPVCAKAVDGGRNAKAAAANLRHRAKHSRHHTKDKQGFVVSVVAYDSLPGHHCFPEEAQANFGTQVVFRLCERSGGVPPAALLHLKSRTLLRRRSDDC